LDFKNLATNLEEKLQLLRQSLRPGQQIMGDWRGGEMAISAVPGAGKSHSLSVAAALAVARYQLHPRRQLVVVTYTRSAAASIKEKIRQQLKDLPTPPGGYGVHTLHGLALNIASRHPELSQLNLDSATLINPNVSHRLIRSSVEQFIAGTPSRYRMLLEGLEFDGEETERLRRQSVLRTEVLPALAQTAIGEAKSSGLLPEDLERASGLVLDPYGILAIAGSLYRNYQELMQKRDLIDYQDMILAALRVLESPPILQLWQGQVFAVFEDEAQDSSPLQERLIKTLATDPLNPDAPPNLVRVGDPNQAINSTFTPADPIYFNWFCSTCKERGSLSTMDQAGRSSQVILDAANFLLRWVNEKERNLIERSRDPERGEERGEGREEEEIVNLPFRLQEIRPVDPDDPQPEANPEPMGKGLEIHTPADVYATVELIGKRVVALLKENPSRSAAILVRENRQGRFLGEQLAPMLRNEEGIKIYEVSEFQRHSQIPGEILKLLQFVYRPHSPDYLKAALEVLQSRQLIPTQDLNVLATFPEQFLYPGPLQSKQKKKVAAARRYCCNLLQARLELPHYQLIYFLAMTLKYVGSELATVEKLAERVNQQIAGNSSIETSMEVLQEIASSERFEAVEEETEDQYTRGGQITIITMHKAKGLDWDYVFVPFLHEDILPGSPWVPTAAKFLGDFTLAEVARAQIRAIVHGQYGEACPERSGRDKGEIKIPEARQAWQEAAKLKRAEEFRLLYVAMTRAKRLLWMSAAEKGPFRWNTFRGDSGADNLQEKKPCPVLPALKLELGG